MVLAAGLGTRMRPLSESRPKPLVPVAGKALIDHVLDGLAAAGVSRAVVNVHYLADIIEAHLKERAGRPEITISDERDALLDPGGGVRQALPLLGGGPFFIHNSDALWRENGASALNAMAALWDPSAMDALLLLAERETSLGYPGKGDFFLAGADLLFEPGKIEQFHVTSSAHHFVERQKVDDHAMLHPGHVLGQFDEPVGEHRGRQDSGAATAVFLRRHAAVVKRAQASAQPFAPAFLLVVIKIRAHRIMMRLDLRRAR